MLYHIPSTFKIITRMDHYRQSEFSSKLTLRSKEFFLFIQALITRIVSVNSAFSYRYDVFFVGGTKCTQHKHRSIYIINLLKTHFTRVISSCCFDQNIRKMKQRLLSNIYRSPIPLHIYSDIDESFTSNIHKTLHIGLPLWIKSIFIEMSMCVEVHRRIVQ